MNKKIAIIFGFIILIISIIIALVLIKSSDTKKDEPKEVKPDLTKNVQLKNYKIDNISIKSEDGKFKIIFNITNISKKAQYNNKIYIELTDNKKTLETLQASLVPVMQANQTISIEACGTIAKDKVKHIKYTVKEE